MKKKKKKIDLILRFLETVSISVELANRVDRAAWD